MARVLHHFRYLFLFLVFLPAVVWALSPQAPTVQSGNQLTGDVGPESNPLLAADSHLHYVFAVVSAALFISAALMLLRRDRVRLGSLLVAGTFTATIGIVMLLAFQQFAATSTQEEWIGGRNFSLLHYLVEGIAYSYQISDQHTGNILIQLVAFIFGVGLCEETTKLLPVLYLLRKNPQMTTRDARILGFVSGVGFGVAEGIIYSQRQYNGAAPALIYVVRFISCVGFHAMLTATAAGLVAQSQLLWTTGAWPYFRRLVWIIMPLMILHAAYDTFEGRGFAAGALACELVLFFVFALQIERDQVNGPFWQSATRRKLREAPTEIQASVNQLLAKIRDQGLDALTPTERDILRSSAGNRPSK